MRRLIPLLLLLAACSSGSGGGPAALPGRGAVSIEVVPNPIVARPVSGTTYEFAFEVVVRETGGRPVEVTRVTAEVFGPGGLSVGRESWDGSKIRGLGFSTAIPANGEQRYRFSPRQEVPDERLLGAVYAELRLEGRDDGGSPVEASTRVTVRR